MAWNMTGRFIEVCSNARLLNAEGKGGDMNRLKIFRKAATKRRTIVGIFSVLMVVLLAAAACGEEATPTPVPATATPVPPTATPVPPTATPVPPGVTPPAATATPVPPAATATPAPTTGLRPIEEWTVDNPGTLEEVEAQLEKHRGESFSFVSWGGAWQSALREAWLLPFQKEFGIEIIEDSPVPGSAKIRAAAETGNIAWDVIDQTPDQAAQLRLTDSIEELDMSIIDLRDFVDAIKNISPYLGGGGVTWSTVLAYNTDVYPGDTGPKSWADFFDLERFPGRRALSGVVAWGGQLQIQRLAREPELLNTPEGRRAVAKPSDEQMVEDFAWFADWVDQAEAANSIIYWSTGSDCPQMLISGEVDMCSAWNGRIYDAQQEGVPIRICWECGHFMGTGGFSAIKGLKEQDPVKYELVNLFMAWVAFPENAAEVSKYISYGPTNLKSATFIDGPDFDDVRDHLPSSGTNIPYAVFWDEVWLGSIMDVAEERYIIATQ